MKTRIITAGIAAAALLLGATPAFAQSTITGSLSSGGAATTGTSSSLSGSVATSGNSLTGTVSSPATGGTTGGGGGGGGGGSNIVDICPNLGGIQASLPSGYVMQNGNCVLATGGTGTTGGTTGGSTSGSGSVLGTSTGTPNVPNTGTGGDAVETLLLLAASAAAAVGGGLLLKRRTT